MTRDRANLERRLSAFRDAPPADRAARLAALTALADTAGKLHISSQRADVLHLNRDTSSRQADVVHLHRDTSSDAAHVARVMDRHFGQGTINVQAIPGGVRCGGYEVWKDGVDYALGTRQLGGKRQRIFTLASLAGAADQIVAMVEAHGDDDECE